MIVTEKLQKITHTLLSILAAATLALSMASAAFAQEITERYTSLYPSSRRSAPAIALLRLAGGEAAQSRYRAIMRLTQYQLVVQCTA